MNDESKIFHFPGSSWKEYEKVIKELGLNSGLKSSYVTNSSLRKKLYFLEDIGFVEEKYIKNLSSRGKLYFLMATGLIEEKNKSIEKLFILSKAGNDYFDAKFVLNNDKKADQILKKQLFNYEPVQVICQILWGKKNLNKESIYNLLSSRDHIDPKIFKLDDLGSFLMLLNKFDMIKYSKKNNTIVILYNPEIEAQAPDFNEYYIDKGKPYSNLLHFKKCIRACKQYIWWFEKHFSKKIFEIIVEEADAAKVEEIKLLFGTVHINENVRSEYRRLKSELDGRGIKTEFKVICDKNILHNIHGRWITAKNVCFKIPPINTILQGQADEISKTENRPEFEQWWEEGKDIITEWNEIQKYLGGD